MQCFRPFTQDNSGTIEREEFLSLPQISSNPLATRFETYFPHLGTSIMSEGLVSNGSAG